MPIYSTPERGIRREDVVAGRLKVWDSRTNDEAFFRFGDVIAGKPLLPREKPSRLWLYGYRRADWWIKPRLSCVVFRPYLIARKDLSQPDGGHYDYDYTRGAFILIWGSSFGVKARRKTILWDGDGRHYREIISEE